MALNINKEGAAQVRSFLLDQGFTEAGVYGMMANIYAESNFYSNNLQNSYNKKLEMSDEAYTNAVDTGVYTKAQFVMDFAGYGLCQWTYWTRKKGLYEYAACSGCSIGDMHMQLTYLMKELNEKYADMVAVLKESNNAEDCAKLVMTRFERPADQSEAAQNRRAGYVSELKKLFVDDVKQPVKKLRIALDAGHGPNTAGKRCMKALDANETREFTLNKRIVDYVVKMLSVYNCEVLCVHDSTGSSDVPLFTRVSKANNWNADVYISVHHNAGVKGKASGGTVVYYCSSNPEHEAQACRLYSTLIAYTGLKGNRSTPVINKGFYVIRRTKMPAFLIENGFMDSSTDVPIILTDEHARKTASAIVQFLVDLGLAIDTNVYYPACSQDFVGIVAALNSISVDSSFAHRTKIAAVNGIPNGYKGTAEQNTVLLNLLKNGLLKKA